MTARICAYALALTGLAASGAAAQVGADYVIGAQDVLAVSVFDHASLSGRFAVEGDGSFSFPLLGRLRAGGLTVRQFENELKQLLADGFIRSPQVAVTVEHYRSRRIFVIGEVRQPGTYPLTGEMTLIEALARAGSLTATAAGEVVVVRGAHGGPDGNEVVRIGVRELEASRLSRNVALADGDTIFVPRSESVYVFGEVRNPGMYPIPGDLTVLQALALAGGGTEAAALNRVKVVRTVNGEKLELKVRLNEPVRPGDTIIVPVRFF
jgi:polysaccharide export outer membrane protein